jgi:hypothetical protein
VVEVKLSLLYGTRTAKNGQILAHSGMLLRNEACNQNYLKSAANILANYIRYLEVGIFQGGGRGKFENHG